MGSMKTNNDSDTATLVNTSSSLHGTRGGLELRPRVGFLPFSKSQPSFGD